MGDLGARRGSDDSEMQTLRPQRKSRIMGLGWPEEAAAAREMGRAGSDTSFISGASGEFGGAIRAERNFDADLGRPGVGEESSGDADEEITIALTPESLPVLLEYLRQCEGKLREWRERVSILEKA
jgi:hypothetical protein